MPILIKCDQCGKLDATEYAYPDGSPCYFCDECADGLFCPGCHGFVGGTEDPIRFDGMCAECYFRYDRERDDEEWDDDEDDYLFYGMDDYPGRFSDDDIPQTEDDTPYTATDDEGIPF